MSSGEIVETQGSQSVPQVGTARARMVQRLLSAATNLPEFLDNLVRAQAFVVVGTEAAAFILEKQDTTAEGINATLRPVAHIRPDDSNSELRTAALKAFQEIIGPCVEQGRDAAVEVQSGDEAPEPQFCLVTLLRQEGEIVAATAVVTRCRDRERAQQRLMSMQLLAGYFDLFTLRKTSEQSQVVAQSHQHVLQLATAVATAEGFESAAMNLCNELAARTGASRVALGWVKRNMVRVAALSHTEQFDKHQELIKRIEVVMEECMDQHEPVHFDPDGGGTANVSRSAQQLSRSEGGNIVLSLPLRRRAEVVGVVTLEFPHDHKLSPQALAGLAVAVDLLAPQLFDRYENDRWLIVKAGNSAKVLGEKVLGPQHTLAKIITIAVIAGLIFVCPFKPMYHVSAPFMFDSIDQRKLQAPFDGYIEHVYVQPGNTIKKGQLLLEMDTSDIRSKLANAEADVKRYEAEYKKDAADQKKQADAEIAKAEVDGANANVKLYQDDLDRAQIKAPFDGVVLSGDLIDQQLAPKKQGEDLFLVAANSSLRAQIAVNDRDIQELQVGQVGTLATTTLPTQKFNFTIDRIVPLGQAKEGENVFTVYGQLPSVQPTWAPGMTGEVSIAIEHRPLIWIWTHRLVDFLRLKLWV